jgi:uncharacterized membrane protein YphA (DoxX/SURF4 family)
MFATFPDGWSGAGLLLLRAAAGLGLIVQGGTYLWNYDSRRPLMSIAAFLLAAGALILTGYLTRFAAGAAVLISLGRLLAWIPAPHIGLFESRLTTTLAAVIAVALLCTGPGSISLEARLFGKREVFIPRNRREPEN